MSEKTSATGRSGSAPKLVFIAVFLVVFVTAFISTAEVTYILPRSYMSTVRILLTPTTSVVGTDKSAGSFPDPFLVQTELEVIQSELVLGPVVSALNLNAEWGKKCGGGNPLTTLETMQLLIARMELRQVRNTSTLEVRIFNEDPVEAARIANAIAGAYREFHANHANSFEVQILDTAHPGDRPVRPNVPLNLAAGALVGIMLGSLLGGGAALLTAWIMRRAAA